MSYPYGPAPYPPFDPRGSLSGVRQALSLVWALAPLITCGALAVPVMIFAAIRLRTLGVTLATIGYTVGFTTPFVLTLFDVPDVALMLGSMLQTTLVFAVTAHAFLIRKQVFAPSPRPLLSSSLTTGLTSEPASRSDPAPAKKAQRTEPAAAKRQPQQSRPKPAKRQPQQTRPASGKRAAQQTRPKPAKRQAQQDRPASGKRRTRQARPEPAASAAPSPQASAKPPEDGTATEPIREQGATVPETIPEQGATVPETIPEPERAPAPEGPSPTRPYTHAPAAAAGQGASDEATRIATRPQPAPAAADGGKPEEGRWFGPYLLLDKLGEGGQGAVFLARHPDGSLVAVKLLHYRINEAEREGFVRELTAARRVPSFSTARMLDAGVHDGVAYIVSEYVDGPSLQRKVQRSGPLDGDSLIRLAIATSGALAAIHKAGIVHRDFKPANVLLAPDGPRVIDFGVAKALEQTSTSTAIKGTPLYMSPEQINGGRITPASDMFSWASTMIFGGTGRAPFAGSNTYQVLHRILSDRPDLSGLPEPLVGPIAACLDKDPRNRPRAAELIAAITG